MKQPVKVLKMGKKAGTPSGNDMTDLPSGGGKVAEKAKKAAYMAAKPKAGKKMV